MRRKRITYQDPTLEEIEFNVPRSLLVSLSVCGEVEDWEDGGEL